MTRLNFHIRNLTVSVKKWAAREEARREEKVFIQKVSILGVCLSGP